ncbi:MAG: BamA/TamA family outer membrane protein [Candidatus Limisoma sp.]|nr:BamA/TamA family outer membrane protein [Bacteroidales bacterium]MDY5893355.1 BamA/TamA family outer membrane protein [Candidatus Limisoma sp.]
MSVSTWLHRAIVRTASVIVLAFAVSSCNTTKHVPEGSYLVNDVKINVEGDEISRKELHNYLRQTPNHEILGGLKFQLGIYNLSSRDTSKRFGRWLRRVGQAPVIYDRSLTEASQQQLRLALVNKGYIDARVGVDTVKSGRKIAVTYNVHTGEPHRISTISYNIDDDTLRSLILGGNAKLRIGDGDLFDRNELEQQRIDIANRLRQMGYFGFSKDYITYTADTTQGSKLVELEMNVRPPYQGRIEGYNRHQPFYVHRVFVVTNYTASMGTDHTVFRHVPTTRRGNIDIIDGDDRYLRHNIIEDACFIRPGEKYNSADVDKTYQAFGRLGILKYINIAFETAEPDDEGNLQVDAFILLTKGKPQTVSVSLEGTNSEGDLGFGVAATYQHRNIARGSETLTTKLGINYESISGDVSGLINNKYAEYSGEVNINFPKFIFPFLHKSFRQKVRANTEFGTSFTYQERPEYTRIIAGAGWKYKWTERGSMINHVLDLVDVNYIRLPNITDEFLDKIAPDNPLLRYSYEDHFIMRTGYSMYYTNKRHTNGITGRVFQPNVYTFRTGIETGGNLLNLISRLSNAKRDPEAQAYKVFGIQYSQYVKFNLDYSLNHSFDRRNSLVFHVGAGAGIPYGNSSILPFEKRFYSGGANSVRGWSVRTLGPGRYNGNNSVSSFMEQCGDIRLDLNLEYRARLFWVFELAAFIDAGNIWTIRNYDNQPGGQFKFNSFYKEIAAAYGLGLRMNFNYFLLRLDLGMKAYNPAYGQERVPLVHPDFSRDHAFHFSVGYPF